MTTTETILSAVGGAAGLGAVARALWTWWTERDKAARDAAAERARATHAADTDATAALVAELKAQNAASEQRAVAAAEGRAQVAAALTAAAHAQSDVTRELRDLATNVRAGSEALTAKVDDLNDRLARIEAALATLTGRAPS